MNKTLSLEALNTHVLNDKINEILAEQGLSSVEEKCRLVRMTLRHDVHHFPVNIPFIAAIRHCTDGKNVVINLQRGKTAIIDHDAISSETNVRESFKIGKINYVLKDTINGFPRYEPKFRK